MNFTGIDFSLVSDNSYAYIAFDLEYGFRLLEERRDSNAVYFRDLSDADADGISDSPITTSAIVVKSNLLDYSGSLSSLEDKIGSLIKIGDTWATILFYNNANSVTVDNYPIKLPPIQSVTPGSPGVITIPNHGLANNTPIKFSSNTMPAGMTAGTTYYVRNATTNTFTISTTSGGASIAINSSGSGELFVSKLYSVFLPTLDYDKIKDTIIGKVSRVGSTFTIESYYDVSGEAITTLELVSNLDNLIGDYEGQIVLNSQDNQVYTWNGISWIIGTGQSARSVFLTVTDQAFEYNASGNLVGTPTSTLTASVINATGVVTYDFKVDGVSVGSSASYEYTPNTLYSEMPDVVSVDVYEDGILVASDFVTMYGVLDGADATTVILSNEAHTLPASSNGDVTTYANSGTNIQVFSGITELQYVSSNPGSGEFTVIAVGTFITSGVPTTSAGKFATVPDHSNMLPGEDTAIVTYTINVEGLNTVTKVQSLTKSKQGTPGSAGIGAATAKLDATTYVITYDADDSNPSPSGTITLTAQSQNIGTPWFKFTGVGGGFDDADFSAGTGDTKTKSLTIPSSYFSTPYKIRVDVSDGDQTSLAFDSINVLAVKPGLDAITGLLTNENHTVAADSDGSNYSLGGAGGTFLVYDGISNVTTSATFSGGTTQNGLTITIGSDGVYSLSGASWTSDSETFTLTATYKGVTITKVYTITKSKAGVIGADADYVLVTGEQSFKFLSGATAPINPTIILSAQLFGSLTTYDWEFWNTSLDIPDWQNLSAPQDAQTYSLLHSSFLGDSIRIRCISGGKFDEITIVKLYDGEDTLSGYLTNENHTVPATFSGAVTQTDLDLAGGSFKVYEGLTDVTSSASFSGNASKNGLSISIGSNGVYSLSGTLWNSDTETFTLTATYKGVTISKVYTISKSKAGVDGTGSDGVVINLSNDNITVPANFDGTNPNLTGATTEVFIYEGTFDTTGDWNITAVASLGVSGNLVGANYTVTGLTADSGTVTFTATRSGYDNQVIIFTISKARGGQDGSPATVYEVRPSVDIVRKSNAGAYTPTTVTFSAFSTTGSNAPTAYSGFFIIYTSTDGVTFTDRYTSSVNESFYTYTIPADIAFIRANLYLAGGTSTLLDSETIPVISDGTDGADGVDGQNGNTVAQVTIYRRSTTQLSTPTGGSYNFTTNVLTAPSNWFTSIPSGTDPLYASVAIASIVGTTGVDNELTWSTPNVVAQSTAGKSVYTAVVFLRSATQPSPPTGGSMNFGTNVLTPPSGWFLDVPSGSDPAYGARYVFSVDGDTGIDTAGTWSTPFKIAEDGIDGIDGNPGADGLSTFLISIYRRSATALSTPTGGSYNFTSNTVTPPTNWSTSVPSGTDPVYISTALASIQGITGTDSSLTWTLPVILAQNGVNGVPGANNAVVSLYSKNTSNVTPPTSFTGTATYTFSTNTLTNLTFNSWSQSVPSLSTGEYLWVRQAVASSTTNTDTIAIGEWSGAVVLSSAGVNGLNTAPIFLYNKNTSSTTAPASFTGTATYTFSTNSLTGLNLNGWTRSAPSLNAGEYLWVRQAVASSNTSTDTILIGEWSTAVVVGYSGINGVPGANNAVVSLYSKNTSNVTPPTSFTGTATYTFSTNTLTNLTFNSWSQSVPSLSTGEYLWVRQAVASSTTNTDTIAIGEWSGAVVLSSAGTNGTNGINGLNTTPIFLYNKNTSSTTAPASFTGTATYTFSTNSLTNLNLNGWARSAPSLNAGEYLWVRQAVASSNTSTDIIAIGEWSTAAVVGIGGATGATGARGAGRWHIDVDAVNYVSGTDGRLPLNSADAQEAWDEGVFVGTRPGNPVQGDQAWFFKGTASNPTSQNVWIYSGSTWALQDEVIDGNLLVTGTITGDKVAANTITASKITIGDSSNMLPDWSQGSNDGWTLNGFQGWVFDAAAGAASGWRLQSNARDQALPSNYLEVTPGESYFFSAWVYNTAPETANILLNVRDGGINQTWFTVASTTEKNIWVPLSGVYTIPNTAGVEEFVPIRARPYLQVDKTGIGDGSSTYWTKPIMRRATDDSLVVNGSISADKLNVTQLSAITATIGTLRTAETGARTEIKDNLIEVYDSSNQLRVRLGVWT